MSRNSDLRFVRAQETAVPIGNIKPSLQPERSRFSHHRPFAKYSATMCKQCTIPTIHPVQAPPFSLTTLTGRLLAEFRTTGRSERSPIFPSPRYQRSPALHLRVPQPAQQVDIPIEIGFPVRAVPDTFRRRTDHFPDAHCPGSLHRNRSRRPIRSWKNEPEHFYCRHLLHGLRKGIR